MLDGTAPSLIVTSEECDRTFPKAGVLRCGKGEVDLPRLLEELGKRGVRRLLVEGGSTVIASFLSAHLADELLVFVASAVLGGRSSPTLASGQGVTEFKDATRLRLDRVKRLGDGLLLEYAVMR